MKDLIKKINDLSDEYLIMDGNIPTISLGFIKEEIILFNIKDKKTINKIYTTFTEITGKEIDGDYIISKLSHGQRLILSAIIALNSNAKKILFSNFFISVSNQNVEKIKEIIKIKEKEGKIIKIDDTK